LQYFGGKQKISKYIAEVINDIPGNYYYEPFVGGGSVLEKVSKHTRIASDINKYLISMYNSLQNGWIPPKSVSEEEYNYIKNNKEEDLALAGFVGFGCSFGGKFFGGYARDKRKKEDFAFTASNSLINQLPKIKNVEFFCGNYLCFAPINYIIYCDPPYVGTTKYSNESFDHELFWKTMRKWSKNNIVFISEYVAPNDFECVLEIPTRTDMRNKNNNLIPRVEKLFKYIQ